jgi:NodT family efflux transporter outer membrane factor (OMF) lipoprotein
MNNFQKIAAVSLLAGCTLGPNYQQPDLTAQLPAQYQTVDGSVPAASGPTKMASDSAAWWSGFNDTAINDLVAAALQRNLDLDGADATIRAARAQLDIEDSASQPQVNAGARVGRDQFSRNSENFSIAPFPNPRTKFDDYKVGFDASWEIDLFGHNRRSVEAAQARLNGIEFQRQAVALRVAAEVVKNVIDYRAWQQRTVNAQQVKDDSQHLLELIGLQQKAGLLSDAEVSDAQTAAHNAAASLPALQSAASAALMALTVLTNQNQEQVSAALKSDMLGDHVIPEAPLLLPSPGLPSELLLRRADLRSAERALAASTADIGVARANQYPRLTLLASGGLDSITPGKLTDLASRYWSIGPQLSVPLLSGGRLAAQVSASEAARDAALAQYRQAVLLAFADTETALIRYQREQQRLSEIRLAFESQQQQLRYANLHYDSGDTNFIPVLQSRQQLAVIIDAQLISQQSLADDLTALYKVLGGGMDQTP